MEYIINYIREKSEWNIDTGCLEWKGTKTLKSYGTIKVGTLGHLPVHRVSYQLYYNKLIPEGMILLHSCDNPPCINPRHLRVGTYQDNMIDKIGKGRSSVRRKNINDEQKLEIQNIYSIFGNLCVESICNKYKITYPMLMNIINIKKDKNEDDVVVIDDGVNHINRIKEIREEFKSTCSDFVM